MWCLCYLGGVRFLAEMGSRCGLWSSGGGGWILMVIDVKEWFLEIINVYVKGGGSSIMREFVFNWIWDES